jgi:hypothetical protein
MTERDTTTVVWIDFGDPIALLTQDPDLAQAIRASAHPAGARFEVWRCSKLLPAACAGKTYHWPHRRAAFRRMIREAIAGAKPYQLEFDFGDYDPGCSSEYLAAVEEQ